MGDVLKAAFVGFRHMHMFDIHAHLKKREDVRIVAICEEDSQIRARLAAEGKIAVSHASFQDMLGNVDFDLRVVGEVFTRRGPGGGQARAERQADLYAAEAAGRDPGSVRAAFPGRRRRLGS